MESAGPRNQPDGTVPMQTKSTVTTTITTTTTGKIPQFELMRMGEQKCVLTQSCCGCSLRSGSLAIAITGLILAIIGAIQGIYYGVNGQTQGWIDLVINLITIVICSILIQGVRQEKRGMVMVWVWVTAILLALYTILAIVGIIVTLNIIGGIIVLLIVALAVYCVLVVRSYAISLSGGSGGMA